MHTRDLEREYEQHFDAKQELVRRRLAEHGLESLFHELRPCPVASGYRGQATLRPARPGGWADVQGVDPRAGRRAPLGETLWTLPVEVRPGVILLSRILAASDAGAAVSGVDLRLEHGSARMHVELAAPRGGVEPLEPLCGQLLEEVPGVLGVSVPSRGIEMGEAYLRNRLRDTTVLAHYRAFFQTNLRLTPALVDAVQQPLRAPERIVDLYCGVGLHSVLAAGPATRVLGVDSNRWAIESARRNADLHGLAGARYHRGAAERFDVEREAGGPTVAFVNPSRFGCEAGVPEEVAGWRPASICLISCSLESHLRDTRAFQRAGYQPVSLEAFDMFPFRDFLESVSYLLPTPG